MYSLSTIEIYEQNLPCVIQWHSSNIQHQRIQHLSNNVLVLSSIYLQLHLQSQNPN